jgi:hypothetical protein
VVLNYHSGQARFSFGGDDTLEKLSCRFNYTPGSDFLSGEANLSFKFPSPVKTLQIAPGMQMRSYLPGRKGAEINQFRRIHPENWSKPTLFKSLQMSDLQGG